MFEQIKNKLNILWKMANPVYLDFLERQNRATHAVVPDVTVTDHNHDGQSEQEVITPKRPATVMEDDPLDIFPSDDPEENKDKDITD